MPRGFMYNSGSSEYPGKGNEKCCGILVHTALGLWLLSSPRSFPNCYESTSLDSRLCVDAE